MMAEGGKHIAKKGGGREIRQDTDCTIFRLIKQNRRYLSANQNALNSALKLRGDPMGKVVHVKIMLFLYTD